MSKRTIYSAKLQEFRKGVTATRAELSKQFRSNYVATREVEFIPMDASGRVGEPTYAGLSNLTAAFVESEVRSLLDDYPQATGVGVEVGFDVYESFGQYMQNLRNGAGFDYEPRVDHYSVDVPR